MAKLLFDADHGCYTGFTLSVSGVAVLRRIAMLTDGAVARGVDPVEAAERAWTKALNEASWRDDDDGVTAFQAGVSPSAQI